MGSLGRGFVLALMGITLWISWSYSRSTSLSLQREREGARLYQKYCASCHHPQRLGLTGPPLIPQFLRRRSDQKLHKILEKGLPGTQMPPFPHLSQKERESIIRYLRQPVGKVVWGEREIQRSRQLSTLPSGEGLKVKNYPNLTAVVERGRQQVWLMEGEEVLDSFFFPYVHGGLKFSPDRSALFVPARDGWIGKYDLTKKAYVGRVRAGIYLRNIALSQDGKYLFAATQLPPQIVVFRSSDLNLLKVFPLEGKVSAIYALARQKVVVGTFRQIPKAFFLRTDTLELTYFPLPEPFEDFFIGPWEECLVGTTRRGKRLVVYHLEKGKVLFEAELSAMPHLFSVALWYHRGNFYFATPHLGRPWISVWQMYPWRFVKKIPTGGVGFFVRTHPRTPYLFVDNGTEDLVLIKKSDLSVRKLPLAQRGKVLHTEFSADGKFAYISVFHPKGELVLMDPTTLEVVKRLPASLPVGKYNVRLKGRAYQLGLLGEEVFLRKCWGCHHPTAKAFGPSFREIARRRKPEEILGQMADPKAMAKHLGYAKGAMPKIPLSREEMLALLAFIEECK